MFGTELTAKKLEFRRLYVRYYSSATRADCGHALAQYINPELAQLAVDLNQLADWLRKNDPAFPSAWRPL